MIERGDRGDHNRSVAWVDWSLSLSLRSGKTSVLKSGLLSQLLPKQKLAYGFNSSTRCDKNKYPIEKANVLHCPVRTVLFLRIKKASKIMEKLNHDVTGKINLHSAYDKHELTSCFPISCFDYRIPRKAKPRFNQLIGARHISDAGISIDIEQTDPHMAAIENTDRVISNRWVANVAEILPGRLTGFSFQKRISI